MTRLFVLLFAGGANDQNNFLRYRNDLELALAVFATLNGFDPTRTHILHGPGGDTFPIAGTTITAADGLKATLIATLTGLKAEIQADDVLVFFATNHGGLMTPGLPAARLWCWNEEYIASVDFAATCAGIASTSQVYIMGQCNAGGFLTDLGAANRLLICACAWNEESHATADDKYDQFLLNLLTGIQRGAATFLEAYDYAVANGLPTETPQISDPSGLAERTDLLSHPASP